jgi:hypothetical protein
MPFLPLVAEMDDNCCNNPGNEQGKQAEQGRRVLNEPYDQAEYNSGRCAVEDYAAPSLKGLILLARRLPQETSYF